MKLSELHQGQKAIISKVRGRGAFRRRIMEMGFVGGQEVGVVKRAPLQDPIEYSIMGTEVSLREREAELIELFDVDNPNKKSTVGYHGTQDENDNYISAKRPREKTIKVAFVGNPNCGKTTIFNIVSGLHERVGNYSGVTVDAKTASFKKDGYKFDITDLPGTYSLTAYSPEELYVRDFILDEMPDVVINVVDVTNIERNLYLTTQLIDMDIKVVMAMNMFDELEKSGDDFDWQQLSGMMGIPFVPTVGSKKIGVDKLFARVIDVFEDRDPVLRHIHINYGKCLEKSILLIQDVIKKPENYVLTDRISSRFLAVKLLEGDADANEKIKECTSHEEIYTLANERIQRIEHYFKESSEAAITNAKYGYINGALKETLRKNKKFDRLKVSKVIDDIITDRLYSFPFFLLLMWVMFQATFYIGSYPQAWLESIVSVFGNFISQFLPQGIVHDLVIDGIIGGVGGVLVFLPNILILFFFIAIMEDTGYMARVAFIVDKIMHKVGLHGRSFIPLLMGFGCNVPAIMATRTIEGRNDRIVTMLINPFMSCSARLPVYVLLIGAFFPAHPGTMLFLIYSIGIFMAGIMAWVFKNTLLKAKEFPFVMELPPYRIPAYTTILKHMWFKAEMYLKKMAGIIMIASLIMWVLGYFPREVDYSKDYDAMERQLVHDFDVQIQQAAEHSNTLVLDSLNNTKTIALERIDLHKASEQQAKSYIGQMGHFIEPIIQPLGFDWKMGVSLIAGMSAKEIVVSTMGVLYQSDPSVDGNAPLMDKLKQARYDSGPKMGEKIYSPLVAFSFIIFILFYFPCVATIAAIRRESGEWKWALFTVFYTTALAWVASFLVYQIGSLF
ncbi:MAG: ferrous iron transport protein B [Bacteroidetes bacterium]|nr:MAG: ferrous iron transport protein B [Bacteroidota bacterium]